jgi:polysaccharide export outer membrane protein
MLLWGMAVLCAAASALGQQPSPAATGQPEELGDYKVAPGDVLRIAIWKENDLNTEVFVRMDGRITVPLVGDVRAAGRTTEQLTSEIRNKLAAFLEAPQVTVTLTQAISARFFVIGEVQRPGLVQLTGRTTVLQAIALAGGFRDFAKKDRILVIREKAGASVALRFNYQEVFLGTKLDQNIYLEAGDTVIVP